MYYSYTEYDKEYKKFWICVIYHLHHSLMMKEMIVNITTNVRVLLFFQLLCSCSYLCANSQTLQIYCNLHTAHNCLQISWWITTYHDVFTFIENNNKNLGSVIVISKLPKSISDKKQHSWGWNFFSVLSR